MKHDILEPAEMLALAETKEGRRELARYIWKARSAYAAQYVMEALEIVPEPRVQELVCQVIWDKCFACDVFEVLDHAQMMCAVMKGLIDDGGYDA
jgi:hypothetical protein